jgi:hypothetical protein
VCVCVCVCVDFGLTKTWLLWVEEYEEYEGRGSPQAPRALLTPLLRSSFGIRGVMGRQEFGETFGIGQGGGVWRIAPGHSISGIWNPKATIYEQYWIPPGHSISGILNPKVTLYEQYWIPHGRSDSHPDHSGSCIWNPKATLYEKYPIPDYDARGGNLSGKLLLAIQDLASRIQRRPYTKHIGSQTESGIPTLTSQALASGIRRRPYTKKIRSQK